MNNPSIYDELDQAIEAIISQPQLPATEANPAVAELLSVASDLRQLPRPDFKLRLKTELGWVASGRPTSGQDRAAAKNLTRTRERQMLASLFGTSYGAYPVRHANFVASVALHAVAMVLIVGSAFWFAHHVGPHVEPQVNHVIVMSEYIPNLPAHTQAHGGGGAGTADLLPASKGALPRSADDQKTPPLVILENDHPRLTAQPTVIGPDLRVMQNNQLGDPLSALTTPSNGSGVRSGIGPGTGTGVGSGNGPGHGPGSDGGFGGDHFDSGAGSHLIAPRVIYDPDPEYSPEARAAKYQGSVLLWAVIGPDGVPRELRVARALGMGLDEKALEAVRNWRFQPATQDGHPVPVMIEVEVSFHLY
jgi:TonB family protein